MTLFIVSIGGFEDSPQEKPVSQYLKKSPGYYWLSIYKNSWVLLEQW